MVGNWTASMRGSIHYFCSRADDTWCGRWRPSTGITPKNNYTCDLLLFDNDCYNYNYIAEHRYRVMFIRFSFIVYHPHIITCKTSISTNHRCSIRINDRWTTEFSPQHCDIGYHSNYRSKFWNSWTHLYGLLKLNCFLSCIIIHLLILWLHNFRWLI